MKKTPIIIILTILTLCITATTIAYGTDPNTVAVWHFDEGEGSTAVDATGNGNDGILSGGVYGNALYFDGSGDYVYAPDHSGYSGITSITVEAWIYPHSIPGTGDSRIVNKDNGGQNFILMFRGGTLGFWLYIDSAWRSVSSSVTPNLNEWTHVAGTYDGVNMKIWVNGVERGSFAISSSSWTSYGDDLYIGCDEDPLGDFFEGIIDEVRISDSVRYTTTFTPGPFSSDGYTVALYHFDDSYGFETKDSSSYGNDGTLVFCTWNGPIWTTGIYGKALSYDGVDDYVEVPDDVSLDITGDISIEVWMYPRVIDTYKSIIVKGDAAADTITYGLQIQGEGIDGIIRFFQYGSSYDWIDSTVPVVQNDWNYIVVTRDSSNNAKIYLNGELVGSGPLSSGPVSDYPLDIGMHDHATLGACQYFDGVLDEIRIWNQVLSAETIKQHQCLVGEWDFNEGTGTTAFDNSGFENHGELNGASWTTGVQGTALSLDGNDWVKVTDSDTLDLDQFTLEAWIKLDSHVQYDCILAKGRTTGQNYGLFVTPTGTIRLQFQDSGIYTMYETYIDSTLTVIDGEWHYIVGTFDGANLRLYIDGKLEATGSGTTKTPDHSMYDLTFGARYDGSGTLGHYLEGAIDELKIWSCPKQMPYADANGPYTGNEGSSITLDASGSYDPDGTIVSYEWDLDGDNDYDDATGVNPSYTWNDDYSSSIGLKVTDDEGYWSISESTATISNVAPSIDLITMTPSVVEKGSQVDGYAEFSDPGTADTHTATWDWGDTGTSAGVVDQVEGTVDGSHAYTAAGVYTVTLTVIDDEGGSDTITYEYVVVFDPSEGFVTGGGWIDSPAGAYVADPSLTGKATFGFVSKYKKGATTPTGNTEFKFHAASLDFHSTEYEWLVIANSKAMFKGTGTINNDGNVYKFMLSAVDSELTNGDDGDMFRIKIWAENGITENIVYDNQIGDDDDADLNTEIMGGSIVIHTKKK
jgi:PKD repeat protein